MRLKILLSVVLTLCLALGTVSVVHATSLDYLDLVTAEGFGGRAGVRLYNMDGTRTSDRVTHFELWFFDQDDDFIGEGTAPTITGPGAAVHLWLNKALTTLEPDYTVFLYGHLGNSRATRSKPWLHLYGHHEDFLTGTFVAVSLRGRVSPNRAGDPSQFRGHLEVLLPDDPAGDAPHQTALSRVRGTLSEILGPTMVTQNVTTLDYKSATLNSTLVQWFGDTVEGQFRYAPAGGNWTSTTWDDGDWVTLTYTEAVDDLDDATLYYFQVHGRGDVWGEGAWSTSGTFTTEAAVPATLSSYAESYNITAAANVTTTITWNEADSITSIVDDLDPSNTLTPTTHYTVETNTLTIVEPGYLANVWGPIAAGESVVLTINFRWGTSVSLNITSTDST